MHWKKPGVSSHIQTSVLDTQQTNFDWIVHFSALVSIIRYKKELFFGLLNTLFVEGQ
jgi:hypothetical protein